MHGLALPTIAPAAEPETATPSAPGLTSTLVLPPHPSSLRLGRHATRALLEVAPARYDAETVLLLVTELLVNSLDYAGSALSLTLTATSEQMRVEISDAAPLESVLEPTEIDRVTDETRNLRMIRALADRWGLEMRAIDDQEALRVVWFEAHAVVTGALVMA